MKKYEASYTVEMALLLPLLLLTLLLPIYMGYEMYEMTKEESVNGWKDSFCAEKQVRKVRFAEDIWEELK